MLISRLPDLRYDPRRGDLHDWIAAAARHRLVVRERYRRSHPTDPPLSPGAVDRLADREPDPAATFERKHLRDLVRDALSELRRRVAPRDYEAFTLRWIEGLSVREVAWRLRMSEGQVWSSHHRTCRKLRPLLTRCLDPESSAGPPSSPPRITRTGRTR